MRPPHHVSFSLFFAFNRHQNLSIDDNNELLRLPEESFAIGQVPDNWSYSYLKPIPKQGKRQAEWIYIFTIQNTTGMLMERIVNRKIAGDLERRNVLVPNQGEFRAGKHLGKRSQFAYDVYEGFQRKEQSLAVPVDLEDAYNRVQFKLLMKLLVQ